MLLQFLSFLSYSCIFIHFIVTICFYGKVGLFVVTCFSLVFIKKKTPKIIKTLQFLSPKETIMLNALKMRLCLEIEKSILENLFITNSHNSILCRFHTQVIPKLGICTTIPAHSLSSLLSLKALGDPIALNNQPKSVSLLRI